MWPFPVDAEDRGLMKPAFAGTANIGGRCGGSISAAKFLEEFLEGELRAHLGIAGVAWLEEARLRMAGGRRASPCARSRNWRGPG